MINFRYHVVSLVAVFLALAVGIVMGSTVIDRAIVDGLRNRIDTANKNTEEKRAENDQLKTSAKGLNAQNTVLAGHVVRGTLANQTVYVYVVGDVSDDIQTEMLELLSVAQARTGSFVKYSNAFLKSDKTSIVKDLRATDNYKTLVGTSKNEDAELSIGFNAFFNQQSGNANEPPISPSQLSDIYAKYGVFDQKEQATSNDPVLPASFIVLVNRKNLDDERTASFVSHLHSIFPMTIGLVGSNTDDPTRSNAINKIDNQIADISIVDNAESPSGRAALLVAHAQNIVGMHSTFGVSDKAKSPAPELTTS